MAAGAEANKVLTTDASGVASWQTAAADEGLWIASSTDIYYNTGNVGIGTTNPQAKLDIKRHAGTFPDGPAIRLTRDYAGNGYAAVIAEGYYSPIGEMLLFGVANNADPLDNIKMAIGSNSNVGIGTIEPTERLHVTSGNVYIENKSDLGSELIIDGDMSNAGSWTANGGAVISGGVASWTNDYSAINQSIPATDGALYKLTYEVVSYTSGNFYLRNYAWVDSFVEREVVLPTSMGTHTVYVVADPGGGDYIEFGSVGGPATYEIDNVSLKEVTGGDLIARGILTGGGTSGIKILGNGNVGIGVEDPRYALDVAGNVNLRKDFFYADNITWKSLNYNMVQSYGGGAALVMCSTNSTVSGGHVAVYIIRATYSSTSAISAVYLGGTLNMFSFRNNNGNLEVKGWDPGVGLQTNATCSLFSAGSGW